MDIRKRARMCWLADRLDSLTPVQLNFWLVRFGINEDDFTRHVLEAERVKTALTFAACICMVVIFVVLGFVAR